MSTSHPVIGDDSEAMRHLMDTPPGALRTNGYLTVDRMGSEILLRSNPAGTVPAVLRAWADRESGRAGADEDDADGLMISALSSGNRATRAAFWRRCAFCWEQDVLQYSAGIGPWATNWTMAAERDPWRRVQQLGRRAKQAHLRASMAEWMEDSP